jgi:predicted RNase H-like nuclease (RuvC/YqgF family)
MNYIKQLQAENEQLKKTIEQQSNEINEILKRLSSEKYFWPNNYINTNDLFKPLQDIRMNLTI